MRTKLFSLMLLVPLFIFAQNDNDTTTLRDGFEPVECLSMTSSTYSITSAQTITCKGTDYAQCTEKTWNINLGSNKNVKMTLSIDLTDYDALDYLVIYQVADNGTTTQLYRYYYTPATNQVITTNLGNGKARVYLYSEFGSMGDSNKGFTMNIQAENIVLPDEEDLVVSGNLGVGISSPTQRVDVSGNVQLTGMIGNTLSQTFYYSTHEMGRYSLKWLYETSASSYKSLWISGYGGIKFFTSSGPQLCITSSGNVGIGTTLPSYKLDVSGMVRATGLRITSSSGADFVFDSGYNLRPLADVKSYISEHKHLPEIPSANDMKQNGVNLSELQIQLLQKIEELTLYIIEQDETIERLKQEINTLLTK